ncbi:hypothetical protein SAMN05444421_11332 [Celeribacter marinus]|nr:hypothetical protein SAMN05444421_11332 [Celeribacter marinus]
MCLYKHTAVAVLVLELKLLCAALDRDVPVHHSLLMVADWGQTDLLQAVHDGGIIGIRCLVTDPKLHLCGLSIEPVILFDLCANGVVTADKCANKFVQS